MVGGGQEGTGVTILTACTSLKEEKVMTGAKARTVESSLESKIRLRVKKRGSGILLKNSKPSIILSVEMVMPPI